MTSRLMASITEDRVGIMVKYFMEAPLQDHQQRNLDEDGDHDAQQDILQLLFTHESAT